MHNQEKIRNTGEHFDIYGDFICAEPYGTGHINDTYRVTYDQGGVPAYYIFQKINHNIFKDIDGLMDNIGRITEHLKKKLKEAGEEHISRRHLEFHPCIDTDKLYYRDNEGDFWRCYTFVAKARTYDIVDSPELPYQAAKAFGEFQKLLVDLPGNRLNETIPNFHNTVKRFEVFEQAVENDSHNRAKSAEPEIEFYMKRRDMAGKLLNLHSEGKIPELITHNDTKLNNVLIDDETKQGICVIDLDTVMPGLSLYDFGDMVRTNTSPAAEDERDISKIKMQMPMFEALIKGYLTSAADFLSELEIQLLPFSGKLITMEIGIRFLTDFLEGDVYFKIHRENHNLDRTRTQIALVQSIEKQEDKMLDFIESVI